MSKWFSIVGSLAFSIAAHAHSELAASVPADGAGVATAPRQIELRFTEPVTLTMLSIAREGAAKRTLGPLPAKAAATLAIPVADLVDGAYTVEWRALSGDTHVMSGAFTFAVGAATAAPHGSPTHAEHGTDHEHH